MEDAESRQIRREPRQIRQWYNKWVRLAPDMPGTLFVVATPIGNLEDITVRALRILGEVQLIAAEDTRRTARLLARHAIATPTTSLHEHNEAAKTAAVLARLERGAHVALVSDAGTPTISDPGSRLIRAAVDAGIRVEPIPGPSAVLAALTASGISAPSFVFMGFPPVRSKDRRGWFEDVRRASRPVVFFEAPHRIRRTLEELKSAAGDVLVAVGREMTKVHENFVRGPISEVLGGMGHAIGEFTVVVELGRTTEITGPGEAAEAPAATVGTTNIGQKTEVGVYSKRQEVKRWAQAHGIQPNALYALLESAKKSGE